MRMNEHNSFGMQAQSSRVRAHIPEAHSVVIGA